ncbi:MAG: NUDIX domain-containing protein [Bacteroidota bacterium]
MSFPFNVRVYGLLVFKDHLLISHEKLGEFSFTKLPGGGLEFGEGPKDCIIREFREETGLNVEVVRHFYTTDFFVASAFDKTHQVISIYFLVKAEGLDSLAPINSLEANQVFEWINIGDLGQEVFSFPIDKSLVDDIKGLGQE